MTNTKPIPCAYPLDAFQVVSGGRIRVDGWLFDAKDDAGNGLTVAEHLLTKLYDAYDVFSIPDLGPFLGQALQPEGHAKLMMVLSYELGFTNFVQVVENQKAIRGALNFIVTQSREGVLFTGQHVDAARQADAEAVDRLRKIENEINELALALKKKAADQH